ncbi:hypothetical protein AAMO2058_000441800 [Amorphochlora amoebiformis]
MADPPTHRRLLASAVVLALVVLLEVSNLPKPKRMCRPVHVRLRRRSAGRSSSWSLSRLKALRGGGAHSTSSSEVTAELMSWLGTHNASFDKIRLERDPDRGAGMFATEDIAANETICSIPLHLVIPVVVPPTHRLVIALKRAFGSKLNDKLSIGKPEATDVTFWLWLIEERRKAIEGKRTGGFMSHILQWLRCYKEPEEGNDIDYGPYFRSLPSHVDEPCSWPEDKLELLRGTSLYTGTTTTKAVLKRIHDTLAKEFLESYPGLKDLSLQELTWARSVQNSRSYYANRLYPSGICTSIMMPMLDVSNHKPGTPELEWYSEVHPDLNLTENIRKKARVSYISRKNITKGSQVWNSYGPTKDNFNLIGGYGFMIDNNPNATFRAPLSPLHFFPPATERALRRLRERVNALFLLRATRIPLALLFGLMAICRPAPYEYFLDDDLLAIKPMPSFSSYMTPILPTDLQGAGGIFQGSLESVNATLEIEALPRIIDLCETYMTRQLIHKHPNVSIPVKPNEQGDWYEDISRRYVNEEFRILNSTRTLAVDMLDIATKRICNTLKLSGIPRRLRGKTIEPPALREELYVPEKSRFLESDEEGETLAGRVPNTMTKSYDNFLDLPAPELGTLKGFSSWVILNGGWVRKDIFLPPSPPPQLHSLPMMKAPRNLSANSSDVEGKAPKYLNLLEIVDENGEDVSQRGLRKGLQKGELVLQVPSESIISFSSALLSGRNHTWFDVADVIEAIMLPHDAQKTMLLLHIIDEYTKGKASRYAGILSLLPSPYDSCYLADIIEDPSLHEKLPLTALSALDEYKTPLVSKFEAIMPILTRKFPNMFRTEYFNLRMFAWAYSVVEKYSINLAATPIPSKAVAFDSRKTLVPASIVTSEPAGTQTGTQTEAGTQTQIQTGTQIGTQTETQKLAVEIRQGSVGTQKGAQTSTESLREKIARKSGGDMGIFPMPEGIDGVLFFAGQEWEERTGERVIRVRAATELDDVEAGLRHLSSFRRYFTTRLFDNTRKFLLHGVLTPNSATDFVEIPALAIKSYIEEEQGRYQSSDTDICPHRSKLVEKAIRDLGRSQSHLIRASGTPYSSKMVDMIRVALLDEQQAEALDPNKTGNITWTIKDTRVNLNRHIPSEIDALKMLQKFLEHLSQSLIDDAVSTDILDPKMAAYLKETPSECLRSPCIADLDNSSGFNEGVRALTMQHLRILYQAKMTVNARLNRDLDAKGEESSPDNIKVVS